MLNQFGEFVGQILIKQLVKNKDIQHEHFQCNELEIFTFSQRFLQRFSFDQFSKELA